VGKDFKVTGTPTFIVQGVSGAKGRVFEGGIKPEECFLGSPPLQKK
jgi:protein-disulfide isomerase